MPETEIVPQTTKTMIDWGKLIQSIVMKHPEEIKSLFEDIDPETRNIIFSIIEDKYPVYGKMARMVLSSSKNENEDEEYEERGEEARIGRDREDALTIDDISEIVEFSNKNREAGFNWGQISEMVFRKFEVDWHPNKLRKIVVRNRNTKEKEKKGIIRRLFAWLY